MTLMRLLVVSNLVLENVSFVVLSVDHRDFFYTQKALYDHSGFTRHSLIGLLFLLSLTTASTGVLLSKLISKSSSMIGSLK